MKVVKIILLGIVILIVLVLIIALIVPSQYDVGREITVKAPRAEVFDYIKYLKNQDNFSAWAQTDPNMEKEYKGTDGTVGFISAWDSQDKDVGKGEQEIMKVTEPERIDFELRFKEPFESTDHAYFTTTTIDSTSTLVKWGFNGKMPYPMNLTLLFMDMEEMLAPDLEKGLQNLKTILEE